MAESDDSTAGTLEELLWVVPRFMERTSRQLELSRVLLSHVPCVGRRLAGFNAQPSEPSGTGRDIDVLEVLGEDTSEETRSDTTVEPAVSGAGSSAEADGGSNRTGDQVSDHSREAFSELPDEADLAIPQYDSLAASQVIPRLEMLSPEDLRLILAYEERLRNRQTIVHKVRQLLAPADA